MSPAARGTALACLVLLLAGCAGPPRETREHSESERGLSGNGDTRVMTHEEAQAETREMENVVTDFIHANWTEEHTDAARQRCVVDDSHVIENGASDSYSRLGDAVEDNQQVAKDFVQHAKELGYKTQLILHDEPGGKAWFNFQSKKGLLMAVTLFSDRSLMDIGTPCYSYDWPELTPTPSPSGSAG